MSSTEKITTTPKEVSLTMKIASSRVMEYIAEDVIPQPSEDGAFTLQMGFDVQSNSGITEDLSFVFIELSISGKINNDPNRRVCFLKTEHVFQVEHLDQFKRGDTIDLPKPLTATLFGIALGMSRGILFAKNFGMSYANVILPMMNMEELLPKEPFRMTEEPSSRMVKLN